MDNSLGYSKKGWTDGEIGVAWIQDFDKRTKDKADGRDRLLIVDGHNSHYTRGFLQYARAHRIHVICYPAHATHVYQGLDVVVFAVLKRHWSEERDKWERTKGEGVTKSNFLSIYGQAHLRALTPDLIRTAFRKTGISPFNRGVITNEMMAPSKETSCEGQLPIAPSTPVRIVADLLGKLSTKHDNHGDDGDNTEAAATRIRQPATMQSELESLIEKLQETSLSGLVSSVPLTSETQLEHNTTHLISPVKKKSPFSIEPKTSNEILLLALLRETEATNVTLKRHVLELQATNILNERYCKVLRGQLANQEAKKRKGKEKGKLMGDGLPRFLSGDEFYEKVVEFEYEQKKRVADKKTRKEEREKRAEGLAVWKRLEDERKTENKNRRAQYHTALEKWNEAKLRAKAEGRKFSEAKPVLGKLRGPIPRPALNVACEEDAASSSGESFDLDGISDASDED